MNEAEAIRPLRELDRRMLSLFVEDLELGRDAAGSGHRFVRLARGVLGSRRLHVYFPDDDELGQRESPGSGRFRVQVIYDRSEGWHGARAYPADANRARPAPAASRE
jgi:hypothetical protein